MFYLNKLDRKVIFISLYGLALLFPLLLKAAPSATTAGGALPRFNEVEQQGDDSAININTQLPDKKIVGVNNDSPRIRVIKISL